MILIVMDFGGFEELLEDYGRMGYGLLKKMRIKIVKCFGYVGVGWRIK
jgi:hypothetical protein